MASKQLLLKIKVARIGVALSVWRRKLMSKMKEYLLDQYEQEITPEIDDLIKMKEEEEGNE